LQNQYSYLITFQIEDELEREREVKKNLLVGTLQLKNQLLGYENRISELESETNSSQVRKVIHCLTSLL